MPTLKRRQFLQFAGSAATGIGLSQLNVMRQSDRHASVLAQDVPGKKLALLVGINEYSPEFNWSRLNGCVQDVRMQRELLIHRFGFEPENILTLTDEDATRSNIVNAFQAHLIAQANSDDVVVFHYSGHGSRVVDPTPYRDENPMNSTLVPIDSPLPDNYRETGGTVNDIMGKTLFLLMSQIQTEKVTVVLDSCYSGGGKRGAVTFRSRDGATSPDSRLYPGEAERELQQRLQAELGWSDEEVSDRRKAGIAKGVVIASAAEGQLASDSYFNGFYAGAFTYLLTQYLWQQTGDRPLSRAFVDIDRATQSLGSTRYSVQNPEFEHNLPSDFEDASIYFATNQSPPAEAIVVGQEGDRVHLWMGGIHPDSLAAFQTGAEFTAVTADETALGQVRLVANPNGLEAEGQLVSTARASTGRSLFLQEQIRTVPEDLTLKIGIDESLIDELDRVQRAIATIERVQPKPPGDDDIDYFIGRIRAGDSGFLVPSPGEPPPENSIVLLYPDLSLVPNSWGNSGESTIDAIDRLRSKFRMLLATRIIRNVVNPGSSDLRVDASVNVVGTTVTAAASSINVRGGTRSVDRDESETPLSPLTDIPTDASRLPIDTLIQLQVTNRETRPVNDANGLYVAVLVIDSSGEMTVIYPTDWASPDVAAFVASGQTIQIPDETRGDRFRLRISPPLGITEIMVIASAVPLRSTLTALGAIAEEQERERGTSTRGLPLSASRGEQFVEVAGNLLHDLDSSTRGVTAEAVDLPSTDLPSTVRGVDSRRLTALSITFKVYDPIQEALMQEAPMQEAMNSNTHL